MKRKFLLLICVIIAAVAVMTACTNTGNEDKIRAEGYNVKVVLDCGKYSSEEIDDYSYGWETEYGETSNSEKSNYFLGKIGEQNVVYRNTKNGSLVQEPADTDKATLYDREFLGWYVASVVAYKLDEDGNPVKNEYGQYAYGAVVPQDDDVKFDFSKDYLSLYTDGSLSKYIATKYVYDANSAFDAKNVVVGKVAIEGNNRVDYVGGKIVEVNGVDYALADDPAAALGYSEENGYNVYLYAKWRGKTKFVVEAQDESGNWQILGAVNKAVGKGIDLSESILKKDGQTVINLYTSKEFTSENLYKEGTKFSECYKGNLETDYAPYVFLYAEYIDGEWEVVGDVRTLQVALNANLNVYLKSDVTFTESDNWVYVKEYSANFNGNGHSVVFESPVVINDDVIEKLNTNYGLFGKFNGNLKNVTFENVVLKVELKEIGKASAVNPNKLIACGVFAGEIGANATFTNVKIKGTLDKTAAVAAGWIVNSQGTWYNACAISPVPDIFEDTGVTE